MAKLEKLKKMKDSEIQNWLRTVDAEDLKRGILGIDDDIRKRIFRNMSDQAVKVLKECIEHNTGIEKQVIDGSVLKLEVSLNDLK